MPVSPGLRAAPALYACRITTAGEEAMESDAQVRLVFAGEILQGFQIDEVKRRFGEAFKLDETRLAAMFSGTRTVLKRSVSRNEADRYQIQLGKLGARVHIEPLQAGDAAKAPIAAAAAAAAAPAAPAAAPATPTLAPLEELITCPNCGERQPKRAFCRACTTDIERALASKAEDAERARAERRDAARGGAGGDRWAAPRASTEAPRSSGGLVDPPPMLSLNFEGRMGRISYINTAAVAWGALAMIGIVAAVLLPLTRSMLMLIPLGLGGLLFFVWSFRVMALRLHDFNRSGWWSLLFFVPYLGGLASLVLVFMPGSAEDNDYGERPRQGNALVATIIVVVGLIGLIALGTIGMSSYNQYAKRARAREQASQIDPAAEQQGAGSRLRSAAALEAFNEYAKEPDSKAFAVSGDAWGWRAGQSSPEEAAAKALAVCDLKRAAYTSQCRVVSVNGAWVPRQR
jgi:uncharacterized membrane protein YhaH (DUF805 family)